MENILYYTIIIGLDYITIYNVNSLLRALSLLLKGVHFLLVRVRDAVAKFPGLTILKKITA